MSKELTAEERAFAYLQEREYSKLHDAANWVGRQVGNITGVNNYITGKRKAVADTYKSGKKDGNQVSATQVAMKTAMKSNSSKFDTDKARAIVIDKAKGATMNRVVGGTAGGAVLGGAAGVGIGHLATGKSRKRAAFLESKGDSISNKERAELAHHKGKIKRAKIIGGAVGTIAGGGAGYLIGKGYARKNKLKLLKGYNSKKTSAMNQHNESTKGKDGKGVLDKIADRVNLPKKKK